MEKISINTEYIKLDQFLKYANIVESGGVAKIVIQDELVKVNGEICTQRGKKIRVNDTVEFENSKFIVVENEE